MFPPFAGITSYRVRSHPAHLIAMLCLVVLCLLYIYCFFHLFSPVDPETDAALVIDYVDDDPPPCQSNQASKPPLSIPISPISFPLMLALELLLLYV